MRNIVLIGFARMSDSVHPTTDPSLAWLDDIDLEADIDGPIDLSSFGVIFGGEESAGTNQSSSVVQGSADQVIRHTDLGLTNVGNATMTAAPVGIPEVVRGSPGRDDHSESWPGEGDVSGSVGVTNSGSFSTSVAASRAKPGLTYEEQIVTLEILADNPDIGKKEFVMELTRRGFTQVKRIDMFRRNQLQLTHMTPWISEYIFNRSEVMPQNPSDLFREIQAEARASGRPVSERVLFGINLWFQYCIKPLLTKSVPEPCYLTERGSTISYMRLSESQMKLAMNDSLHQLRRLHFQRTHPDAPHGVNPAPRALRKPVVRHPVGGRGKLNAEETVLALGILANDPYMDVKGFIAAMGSHGAKASITDLLLFKEAKSRCLQTILQVHQLIVSRLDMMPGRLGEVETEMNLRSRNDPRYSLYGRGHETLSVWYQYCIDPLMTAPETAPCIHYGEGDPQMVRLSDTQASHYFVNLLKEAKENLAGAPQGPAHVQAIPTMTAPGVGDHISPPTPLPSEHPDPSTARKRRRIQTDLSDE